MNLFLPNVLETFALLLDCTPNEIFALTTEEGGNYE